MPAIKQSRREQAIIIVKDVRSQTGLDVEFESSDRHSRLRLICNGKPITLWSEGLRDFERQCTAVINGCKLMIGSKSV